MNTVTPCSGTRRSEPGHGIVRSFLPAHITKFLDLADDDDDDDGIIAPGDNNDYYHHHTTEEMTRILLHTHKQDLLLHHSDGEIINKFDMLGAIRRPPCVLASNDNVSTFDMLPNQST